MAEIRIQAEGSLRWIYASGSGNTWATASAAASALMAHCRGLTFDSARTVIQATDRGVPSHHKVVSKQAIPVSFEVDYGITANYPSLTASGSGASVPMVHFEYKALAPEVGSGSGIYYQFHGVAINSLNFSEGENADTLRVQGMALAMNGPQNSGYLS